MKLKIYFLITIFLNIVFNLSFASDAKWLEKDYQKEFAESVGGKCEVVMQDGTRCDILTDAYAIEVDYERKWAEAIGQCLHYSFLTGRRPGILLIIESPDDLDSVKKITKISDYYFLGVTVWVTIKKEKRNDS